MNRKGFTLVELLMVIILLAIIGIIIIPNMNNIINKSKNRSCESLKKNIISATKIYVNENKYDLGFSCTSSNNSYKDITLEVLINAGKINSPITNPKTKKEIDTTSKVRVEFNCDTKDFTYEIDSIC